ncbi:hypothetical protein [Ruminococcus albus]|uniref:Uncharacterized protein n=1 Tax=Ruminococcus albus TaxID=1264 RepID=A0A1I1R0E3_RUMAL|nr:hypothetical protein [Ruminococcus albus]SFD27871.1 hypothetical protein SAMN02910406_03565 [Ruminococcus albus]
MGIKRDILDGVNKILSQYCVIMLFITLSLADVKGGEAVDVIDIYVIVAHVKGNKKLN